MVSPTITNDTPIAPVAMVLRQSALEYRAIRLIHGRTRRETRQGHSLASAAEARVHADEAARRAAGARNTSRVNSALLNRSDASLVLALLRELEPDGPLPSQWRELARSATHQDVDRVVLGHPDEIYSAAFSPDSG